MHKRQVVIPVFIPHKGCPFDCIFCNQKIISGQTVEMTIEKMHTIIKSHLKTINPGIYVEIGFYGGSFSGIDRELQHEFLSAANEYVKTGEVNSVRLSTRPDYISPEILSYLKTYNVGTIELGVQSLDDSVLKLSCRGHTAEDVFRSSALITECGITLGLQTMVGLPGDSKEKGIYTAKKIIGLAPSIVRIYPVLVIKGTYLEKMLLEGSYIPLGLEAAVETCAELLDMYEKNNITVIRIGLQSSENIEKDSEVVAGPIHPAFRQLVEAKRTLRLLEECIMRQELEGAPKLIIRTGRSNISNVVGQRKCNINHLKEKYRIGSIKVEDDSMDGMEINIIKST